MKIKEITVHKTYKIGMPNYSSMEVSAGFTIELSENEQPDWDKIWDDINAQLRLQSGNLEPGWLITDQEKKDAKLQFIKRSK